MHNRQSININSRRKKKKKKPILLLFLTVFFVCVAVFGFQAVKNFFGPHYKFLSQWEEGTTTIVIGGKAIPSQYTPIEEDKVLAFPLQFVQEYLDSTLFWDSEAQKLTATNEKNVIRMSTDDLTYYVNNEPLSLDFPVFLQDGQVYIPMETLSILYHYEVNFQQENKIAVLDDALKPMRIGKTTGWRLKLVEEAKDKSRVIKRLKKNTECYLFEEEGEYTKVRTMEGIPGYVLTKNISKDITEVPAKVTEEEEEVKAPWKPETGKIVMVWDQIFQLQQNRTRRGEIQGLDVIAPTWFQLTDERGNIGNIADESYVQWAHNNDCQVWALFSNNFTAENTKEMTHGALSNTDMREKVIRQLLAFVSLYDLDGINIDFENLAKEDGVYFLQFIRELSPLLKAQGVTLSVCRYVPSSWTEHYQMPEVGEVADYITLMAYDEHWATAPESGSTASLGWTESGIQKTLAENPKEKVILGVPFYTRLWGEGADGLTSKALGMDAAYNILQENNAQTLFDEVAGQNYGEYEKDSVLYKIWLEDETSMQSRLQLVQQYDLAGAAGWKRGLEAESVWALMQQYLK